MVSVLHGLGYIAIFATFLFVTLSLASGLLWLSEVIEEHSTTAKVVGTRTIYVVIILHVLLWLIDSFPFPQIAFSILCHCVYLSNFTPSWPLISLTSPSFISSCLLVLTDHFVWFFYFSKRTHAARYGHANWKLPQGALTFAEISTFFGVCVWLVPLFLFLSLSANDNALPVSHGDSSVPGTPVLTIDDPFSGPAPSIRIEQSTPLPNQTLFQKIFSPIISALPDIRRKRTSRNLDGIIAPRTPNRTRTPSPVDNHITSPLPSPSVPMYSPSWTSFDGPSSPHSPRFGKLQNDLFNRRGPLLTATPTRRATTDGTGSLVSASASGVTRSNRAVSSKDEGNGLAERRRPVLTPLDLQSKRDASGHSISLDHIQEGGTL